MKLKLILLLIIIVGILGAVYLIKNDETANQGASNIKSSAVETYENMKNSTVDTFNDASDKVKEKYKQATSD